MNLFTRNSPYYHFLKYLLFLLKHPVYICICIKSDHGPFGPKHVERYKQNIVHISDAVVKLKEFEFHVYSSSLKISNKFVKIF
jgi:hypothetical protein